MADGDVTQPDPVAVGQAIGNNEQMPNVGQASPAPPTLAPQPAQRVGAKNVPLLGQMLADVLKPSNVQSMQAPGPGQMATMRPVSRAQDFEGFLGQFLYAMGQGFANEGRGPGAAYRGAGAAITAPYQQQIQQAQIQQQLAQQRAQTAQTQAQTQLTTEQAAQLPIQRQLQNEQLTQAPRFDPDSGQFLGIMSQKGYESYITGKSKGAKAAGVSADAKVRAAQLNLGPIADVPKDLQDSLGLPAQLPLKMLNQAESAANKPLTIVQGAAGPSIVNKQTRTTQNLGLGSPVSARPVQVSDPTVPGGIRYMPAGEAERVGAQSAGSAAVKIPTAVLKDFTSGQSAKTLNAFNTATDHLTILSQLGDALDNGSVPLINQFANRFATATGGAAPTSFNMAKNAVAGEVAKTFKGNATEGEIDSINQTLNAAQSPAQLKGAINTALRLMNSKRQALMEQYDQGIKGTPAFPATPGQKPTGKALDPLNIR